MTPEALARLLDQNTYIHLQHVETPLARAWLLKHGAEWDSIDFDVNLGEGMDVGSGFDSTTQAQARYLTQKRADMVARRGTEANIIEIKRRVDLPAMGQLLGYATLWHIQHPETTDLKLTAIGWAALEDVTEVLAAHGINVETFPHLNALPRSRRVNPQ